MKRIFLWMTLGVVILMASCQSEPVKVTVVATSDLETSLFSHDYKYSMESRGGAALVADYLSELKATVGEQNVIYVDNGDLLVGWPLNYYMKNIEKSDTTLAAAAMNALGCEVYGIGEGDIAQGKALLDRHVKSSKGAPVCANLVDAKSGEPIYKPYVVVERNGMKIAFLGLITEWADKYMNKNSMDGMKVVNAVEAAQKWMTEIQKNEKPDVVIGLFHMGASAVSKRTNSREDIAVTVVSNVAGFDAVVCGHDGLRRSKEVVAADGRKVTIASPGRRGMYAIDITITAQRSGESFKNKMVDVAIKTMISRSFNKEYATAMRPLLSDLRKAMAEPIVKLKSNVAAVDAIFGSSAYMDLIHKVQLQNSGADLSFAHLYALINGSAAGDISLLDVNGFFAGRGKLYTIKMKGREVLDMLTYSVSRFYSTVKDKDDKLLKYSDDNSRLAEGCKVLETVAGIRYNVYMNKQKREDKVKILGLTNGRPFDLDKEYTVAVAEDYVMSTNLSLNIGAKVKSKELVNRIVAVSEKDMTELVCDYLKEAGSFDIKPSNNWSLQPAAWVKNIKENEMKSLTQIYFPQSASIELDPMAEAVK